MTVKPYPFVFRSLVCGLCLLMNTSLLGQPITKALHWKTGKALSFTFTKDTFVFQGGINYSGTQTFEGGSSISDSLGNLLFYADAERVYNKLHLPMPFLSISDTSATGGNTSSSQSGIIVPIPQQPFNYYVFFLPAQGGVGIFPNADANKRLAVVKVNLQHNGGLGAIEGKVQFLGDTIISEVMCYTNICGSDDYWLLSFAHSRNELLAYRITSTGIVGPVVSKTKLMKDFNHLKTTNLSAIGAMRVSPNGKFLAINLYNGPNKGTAIYSFNDTLGKINDLLFYDSTTTDIGATLSGPYGLAFSPSSGKLYSSIAGGTRGSKRMLYQYNLNQMLLGNYAKVRKEIYSSTQSLGCMQLTPNGNLWFVELPNLIGAIANPDAEADALQITPAYFKVDSNPAFGVTGNLPYFPDFWFEPKAFPISIKDSCLFKRTFFAYNGGGKVQSWQIKDSTGKLLFSSTADTFSYVFPYTGKFLYSLFEEHDCNPKSYDSSFQIVVCPCLARLEKKDSCLSGGTLFTLSTTYPLDSVHWIVKGVKAPASLTFNQNRIFFDSIGRQTIQVHAFMPCGRATINDTTLVNRCLSPCPVYVPSAFTPANEDELNEVFGIKTTCTLETYELRIFDRLSNLMFRSVVPTETWDGTYQGTQLNGGVYYYYLAYQVSGEPKVEKLATITLLR